MPMGIGRSLPPVVHILISVGQSIESGKNAAPRIGNILPLEVIPDGTLISNIEQQPGDGGKFIRASGGFGIIRTHGDTNVIIRMPSGVEKRFNPQCRATLGVIAGGGRTEKPFLKARLPPGTPKQKMRKCC